MHEKYDAAKKEVFLKRIKQMAMKPDSKMGKLEKADKGRYKFTANHLLKPQKKEITHPKKK